MNEWINELYISLAENIQPLFLGALKLGGGAQKEAETGNKGQKEKIMSQGIFFPTQFGWD